MNSYDCSKKICNLVDINRQNLRAADDQILFDNDSYRAAIARASNSLAKKWNKIISYNIGDLVALNGKIFISVTNGNISNNPETSRLNWAYFINPFAKNEGKIKAFCLHKGTTILKSYNIDSISKTEIAAPGGARYAWMNKKEFKFFFSEPFSFAPSFATSYAEVPNITYELYEDRGPVAFGIDNTINYTSIMYTIQATFDDVIADEYTNFVDTTDLTGFVVWYENTENVPEII